MHSIIQFLPMLLTGIGSIVLAAPFPAANATITPGCSTPTISPTPPLPSSFSPSSTSLSIPAPSIAPSNAVPPSKDPWYSLPDTFTTPDGQNWKFSAPGTILKFRSAPNSSSTNTPPLGAAAFNILFRTTDSANNPSWAVTTAYAPQTPRSPDNSWRMLSYQHFEDKAVVDAAPSYQVYNDVVLQLFVQNFLDAGWFVNVPDYEGPKAAFGSGLVSGRATLDSVRAFLNAAKRIGVPVGFRGGVNLTYAMYGYSGGAFATEWAAEIQQQYAPELRFAGAAIGGVFPNIMNTLRVLNAQDSGLTEHLRNGIVGIGNEHTEAQDIANRVFGKATTWKETAAAVLNPKLLPFAELQCKVNILLADPLVQRILQDDAEMGNHGTPAMPLMVHRAERDQLSPTADTTALVDRFCKAGVSVFYRINPEVVADAHKKEGGYALTLVRDGGIIGYFEQMFRGTFPRGCGTVNALWSWRLTMT